ncbi:hypothetical protein MN608_01797 [Microdochium nivale]|nr:hypothetical protein MN608_01797 [Microdochium nivale]
MAIQRCQDRRPVNFRILPLGIRGTTTAPSGDWRSFDWKLTDNASALLEEPAVTLGASPAMPWAHDDRDDKKHGDEDCDRNPGPLTRRNTLRELEAQRETALPSRLYADILAATQPQIAGRLAAYCEIGGDMV